MTDSDFGAQVVLPPAALVPFDGASGMTQQFYNAGGQLKWRNALGDWIDAGGKPQGSTPFSSTRLAPQTYSAPIEIDVTTLVRAWLAGQTENHGFLLSGLGGPTQFWARHGSDRSRWPALLITHQDGSRTTLNPQADAWLDPSTYSSLGMKDELHVASDQRSVIYFDLGSVKRTCTQAVLQLSVQRVWGPTTCMVFRTRAPYEASDTPIQWGIAARYTLDRGLANDPRVLFAEMCPDWKFHERWTHFGGSTFRRGAFGWNTNKDIRVYWVGQGKDMDGVFSRVPHPGYIALPGASGAMECELSPISCYCLDARFYPTSPHSMPALNLEHGPEELYVRFYMRFAADWRPWDGGKLPGMGSTDWGAGRGGLLPHGCDGWVAEGGWYPTPQDDNPMREYPLFRYYIYHLDWKDYGESGPWVENGGGWMRKEQWYCIDQYCKLNSFTKGGTANPDGVVIGWINGRKVYDRRNFRFRNCDKLRIHMMWHAIYHGGMEPPREKHHIWFANMVVAKKYVGPMRVE